MSIRRSPSLIGISPSDLKTDGAEAVNFTFVTSHEASESFALQGIDARFGDQYQCWLFYSAGANTISVWNNGRWTTERAGQPEAILHGNACDIDPLRVSSEFSDAGLLLHLHARITLGGAVGAHNIYMSALGSGGLATVTIAGNPGFSGTVNLSLGAFRMDRI
ncbi:MAG TPA: hypothetical protein VN610_03105 [Bryobacteraceae bacterium]|nr:hypothetical protein [Bryobacteraceae bacterium]